MKKAILKLSLATCLLLASSANSAIAESENNNRSAFPGRRVGGGTRSEQCLADNQALIALNPENNLGITAKSNPTLYFSIPALNQAREAEFVLTDSQGKLIHSTLVTVAQKPQLLSIQLPEDAIATEQNYQWSFSLMCNPQDYTQDVILTGWLQRVEMEAELTTTANQLEKVMALKQQELWLDAIAMLIELRQAQPENGEIEQQWQQALQQLNLDIATDAITISQY